MKLCVHLQPILNLELAMGNSIQEHNEFAWEKCELDVLLKNSFHAEAIQQKILLALCVKEFENRDLHYTATGEVEYFCERCKQMIRAPFLRVNSREYPV